MYSAKGLISVLENANSDVFENGMQFAKTEEGGSLTTEFMSNSKLLTISAEGTMTMTDNEFALLKSVSGYGGEVTLTGSTLTAADITIEMKDGLVTHFLAASMVEETVETRPPAPAAEDVDVRRCKSAKCDACWNKAAKFCGDAAEKTVLDAMGDDDDAKIAHCANSQDANNNAFIYCYHLIKEETSTGSLTAPEWTLA